MKIQEIEISKIKENPYQTRIQIEKEPLKVLSRSILKRGLINPISVLKDGEQFIIISGHRRLRACKSLRWKKIPCIVKDRQKNKELIIDLVHENLVREDLTPLEKGISLKLLFSQIKNTKGEIPRMMSLINSIKNYRKRGYFPEHRAKHTQGLTDDDALAVQEIMKSLGISDNNAVTYLTILLLPKEIQKEICYKRQNGEFKEGISVKVGEQLARIKDTAYQYAVYERAKYGQMTIRHIQALVDDYVKKVENGEWKGFVRKSLSLGKVKDEMNNLNSLSLECMRLSKRITSFKVSSLLKLEATLEKTLFINVMSGLKKELEVLRNRINEKLAEKGFREVKKEIEFEVTLKQVERSKFEKRFTIPTSITKELNLPFSRNVIVKMKITGVKDE